MQNWIYLNGTLVLGNEANISPYDHGFLYGNGLFETMRAYNGKVFCRDEHLKRLERGGRILGWPEWFDAESLSSAIDQTLEKNGIQDASVRLTVSRGAGASQPDPSTCQHMTIVIFVSAIQPLGDEVYEQGWHLVTARIQRNLTSPLCNIKGANYLDNILAKSEARQKGGNEALMLNTQGGVAEGTMCNVFFVAGGRLITPNRTSGLLPGITRAAVLQLARQAGMIVEERQVYPNELLDISEMFITSSLLEIMPITMLDQVIVGNGRPGKITCLLQKEYKRMVKSCCS
ncbi:MAG: aminotransferase class IV [Sporomusaceae bacterium]|nr:aminotransferase class IV [Sporomusaceae bacterium]